MAASMRVVRRPKGSPARRTLTAASQPVDPNTRLRSPVIQSARADWQNEAWSYLDEGGVGELRYYVSWRAGSVSRVRLIASEIDPNTGLPTGGLAEDADGNLSAEQQKVAQIVRDIAGGPLGQAQLLKRATECLTVTGELWVAILLRDDGEHWLALTREEWQQKTGDDIDIEMPDGVMHKYRKGIDRLFRIWNPRPRRAKEADSPVRASMGALREIVRTTKKIKNASKSRLIGNGIMFLPEQMSLPNANGPVAANQPGAPIPTLNGVSAASQLSNLLYNVAKVAVEDEDSQAAFIPIMATVPGEFLEKVQHIHFGSDVTEVEIKTRDNAIVRLAMGLEVNPERMLGLGSNSNHWSAWQIGDEDVQLHIKPPTETIVAALQREVLRPVFEREGIDPAKYTLWYDASQLTIDPDKTDEATEAHDRGAINSEALRRYYGMGDDDGYDFSTLEGWQEWAQDAVAKNPELILTLLPLLDPQIQALDFPQPQPALPPGEGDEETDGDDNPDESTGEAPDTEDDNENNAAARVTPAEMILAERLLVNRALDLAGKRRANTNVLKARLAGMPAHQYHRVLPPVPESDIPRLINGWDVGLVEDEVIARLGVDTAGLREAVRQKVRQELTRPVIDGEAS